MFFGQLSYHQISHPFPPAEHFFLVCFLQQASMAPAQQQQQFIMDKEKIYQLVMELTSSEQRENALHVLR